MTTGQLVFCCGLALLGLTILTAIVFLLKKPKYEPENLVYENAGASKTRRPQGGDPTRRESAFQNEPAGTTGQTELVETEKIDTGRST